MPTDGLILKGWYTTITLAVYGSLTTVEREKAPSPPPPPPPQARSKPQGDLPLYYFSITRNINVYFCVCSNCEHFYNSNIIVAAVLPVGIDTQQAELDFGPPVPPVPVPTLGPALGERNSEWQSPIPSYNLQTQAPPPVHQGSPEQGTYFDSEQGPRTPQDIPLDSQGGAHDPRAMSRTDSRPEYASQEPGEIAGEPEAREMIRLDPGLEQAQDRIRSLSQDRDLAAYDERDYREREHGGEFGRDRSWNREDYRDYRDMDRSDPNDHRERDRGRDSDWEHRPREREREPHISDPDNDRHSERSHEQAIPITTSEGDITREHPWPRSPVQERKSPASIRSRSPTTSQDSRDLPHNKEPVRPEPDTEPGTNGGY